MDFPNVDERTEERFARLYPLVAENVKVKEAAKAAPKMLEVPSKEEKAEVGVFHYKLYENRIPAGVNADEAFGAWATDAAKSASLKEVAEHNAGKGVVQGQQEAAALARFPETVRYYPAVEAGEGKNRDAFNAIVEDIVKQRDAAAKASDPESKVQRKDVIAYNNGEHVKAFVSKDGPIPELAYWQSDEAKQAWAKEGEKLQKGTDKTVEHAKDMVDRASSIASGAEFMGKYGKGLPMPSKANATERSAVEAEIRGANSKDLQEVRAVSEREFKFLERKQYAIQIQGAQKIDPELTSKDFNALKPAERIEKSGGLNLEEADERRLKRVKDGFFTINRELQDRGEHLTVDQARDLKSKGETKEVVKPVDEKGQSLKSDPAPAPDAAATGRQSSKGRSAAAALASQLGR